MGAGRRRSSKIPKKSKPILIKTVFDCAICGFNKCIFVKIHKLMKQAELFCVKCTETFKTNVRGMDEPIDVYHMWLQHIKKTKDHDYMDRFQDIPEGEDFNQVVKRKVQKKTEILCDQEQDDYSEDSLNNLKRENLSRSQSLDESVQKFLMEIPIKNE